MPLGSLAAVPAPLLLTCSLALLAAVAAIGLRMRRDEVGLLTLFVTVLFIVPAGLVLPGLRSFGSPALLLALGATALWWTGRTLRRASIDRRRQPVRILLVVYLWAALASYAAGQMRYLTPLEAGGSTRVLVFTVAACGVALLVADGIHSYADLDRVLQRAVAAGSVSSLAGILEHFSASFSYQRLLSLPGLVLNYDVGSEIRSSFRRVTGSAAHPIEFSVVAALLVPLALHYALTLPPGRRRGLMRLALTINLVAVPMSISRSGVLVLAVCLLVLGASWPARRRLNAVVLGLLGIVALRLVVPGLVGTIKALFLYIGKEPSTTHRTGDIPAVLRLVAESPWFGHGLGTFNPLRYFYLDNQFYGSAIEGGFVLLGAFMALLVIGAGTARGARRWPGATEESRHLAQAVTAAIVGFGVGALTFDALGFRQAALLFFLLLGAAGALWRLVRDSSGVGPRRLVTALVDLDGTGPLRLRGRPGVDGATGPALAEETRTERCRVRAVR